MRPNVILAPNNALLEVPVTFSGMQPSLSHTTYCVPRGVTKPSVIIDELSMKPEKSSEISHVTESEPILLSRGISYTSPAPSKQVEPKIIMATMSKLPE